MPEQDLDSSSAYSPYLYHLSGKDVEYETRLGGDHAQNSHEDSAKFTRTEAIIMREVAFWQQSQTCDEFWTPRTRQHRRALPTASQLLRQLEDRKSCTTTFSNNGTDFEALLQAIALQLLAACYTVLPATSANHIPIFQQRKETVVITALRSNSRHRHSPAAGHQARPPSEAASWPGLYVGPSIEERLAEHVSRRRKLRNSSEYVPQFTGSGWTDGPPPFSREKRSSRSRSSSDSSSEHGFFSRLVCQAAIPKNYRRKHNTMFLSRTSKPNRPKQLHPEYKHAADRRSSHQDVTSQPVQRIPSAHRLRHTQSAPRIAVEEEAPVQSPHNFIRHGSDPSIGSPLDYPFQIPRIRRTSVTPSVSLHQESPMHAEVRACGRGDLIAVQDYFYNVPKTPSPPLRRHSTWKVPNWRRKDSSSLSPSITETPGQSKRASGYFESVYTGKHITHRTDDPDLAGQEHDDAGPEIEDDPRLQRMLSNIITTPSDCGSVDSDMERMKKRKSIIESPAKAYEIAERFQDKTGDGFDHSLSKIPW
ncbi:conserved hypothetical protein [Pyrenophora tritici-repentis Pt-1C-BFP]|uniref:Uncharacterized protein n=1 Tax=Pyrenophora tritici-repentis (strain Pt-1C-BFP) TaxID=426418 RepID=B2WN25_PYRTR|nr:uncharacterized protein PTRG_11474 [Pyrenophora tritici-repentis Pt-1C-BFP]EDU44524.1 conserved hypothetical protein [Pyrenophora tritici-repentis Pt-1C-BFP]